MSSIKPLVNAEYLLKKFPGKGGWTYAEIPEIAQNKSNPFGWVTIRGVIDDYELKHYKLMPMGNGKLFLPVKAKIRKKIKKQAGDYVKVTLFLDETPLEIPVEIIECFNYESNRQYKRFLKLTDGEKKAYLDWIYNTKNQDTKARRILQMMKKLERGLKFNDKLE